MRYLIALITLTQWGTREAGMARLHGYAKHIYGSSGGEPVEQGVRDLLSDLQHTCEHLNIDFMEALERASSVFNSEKEHP